MTHAVPTSNGVGKSEVVHLVTPSDKLARTLRKNPLNDQSILTFVGRGAEGVVRWAESLGPATGLFIWIGVADSLSQSLRPGRVVLISNAMSQNGRRFPAPISNRFDRGNRVIRASVVSRDALPLSLSARKALAERSGAELVDRETALFAEAATLFGWRWAAMAVVRHELTTSMPSRFDRFENLHGRARWGIRFLSLFTEPITTARVLCGQRIPRSTISAIVDLVTTVRCGSVEPHSPAERQVI